MNAPKPSSTSSAKPSTEPSPEPPRPREEWLKEIEEDEKRIQTTDLSKVKVW